MGMALTGCRPPGVEHGCYCAIGSHRDGWVFVLLYGSV